MSRNSKSPRPWPVLIISSGGVVHISRANSSDIGKVHTECGRCIHHSGSLSVSPAEIMESDGKKIKVLKVWEYKFCARCGDKQTFADAKAEFDEAMVKRQADIDAIRDSKADSVSRMQAAIRATLMATCLPEGATDVTEDGWGIKFWHDGKPLVIKPTDEECERLHKVAEENATCPSE